MGIIKTLSRKLSGTRADSGVRSSDRPSIPGDRNGLQPMSNGIPQSQSRTPQLARNGIPQSTSVESVRPQYSTHPSHVSSNQDYADLSQQLCDVVIHCATVLPRTNSNTSSVQSTGIPPNGQHIDFRTGGNNNNGNQRDTIMPLHSEQTAYQSGRVYKQPSVGSSLHSSRPDTSQGQPESFHTPCSCGGTPMGGESRWDTPQKNWDNNYNRNNNRHTMNVGQSHAAAFNNNWNDNNNNNNQNSWNQNSWNSNSWNQSGPPTDSSQSKQRNTNGMERGAYDEGYRDAMQSLQQGLH